jgi:hypothetical protein
MTMRCKLEWSSPWQHVFFGHVLHWSDNAVRPSHIWIWCLLFLCHNSVVHILMSRDGWNVVVMQFHNCLAVLLATDSIWSSHLYITYCPDSGGPCLIWKLSSWASTACLVSVIFLYTCFWSFRGHVNSAQLFDHIWSSADMHGSPF